MKISGDLKKYGELTKLTNELVDNALTCLKSDNGKRVKRGFEVLVYTVGVQGILDSFNNEMIRKGKRHYDTLIETLNETLKTKFLNGIDKMIIDGSYKIKGKVSA